MSSEYFINYLHANSPYVPFGIGAFILKYFVYRSALRLRTSPPDYSLKIIVADMLFLFNLYPMKLTAKLSSGSLPNPEKPFRSLPRKSPENSSSTPPDTLIFPLFSVTI